MMLSCRTGPLRVERSLRDVCTCRGEVGFVEPRVAGVG
jgi:hypothetical protein